MDGLPGAKTHWAHCMPGAPADRCARPGPEVGPEVDEAPEVGEAHVLPLDEQVGWEITEGEGHCLQVAKITCVKEHKFSLES